VPEEQKGEAPLMAARKRKGPCLKWSKGRTRCLRRGKPTLLGRAKRRRRKRRR
jgi:hypothetical protein